MKLNRGSQTKRTQGANVFDREYAVESKDRLEGFGDILILMGEDPLNPDDIIVGSADETVTCDRPPTERP